MDSIYREIEVALSVPGEREVTTVLKRHPLVLLWSFCRTGGHSKYIIPEFEFGNRYRADFVIPLSYSGAWEVHLIELENTDDMVITKAGKPSKRLNSAISQLHDWKSYIENNKRTIHEDLSNSCKAKDILKIHDRQNDPTNSTGDKLKDPDTHIWFYFHIIIGRRNKITKEARRRMNQYSDGFYRIGTFDRFLDVASNLDRSNAGVHKSVLLTETYGV